MKIKVGKEFEFIQKIKDSFKSPSGQGQLGIGDDCSITPFNEELFYITTTDLLIENSHFLRDKIDPYDLGQKAINVNLSDIAAMGGKPLYAFLSLGIPNDLSNEYLDSFLSGAKESLEQYNIYLMGGDTTRAKDNFVINVLLKGEVEKKFIKLRSNAKACDMICTTGNLGNSGIGLQILLDKLKVTCHQDFFIQAHNRPKAHIKEGQWLSRHSSVTSMIDISDGVSSDLLHICRASKLGANIILDKLPISNETKALIKEHPSLDIFNTLCRALEDGEDYCLLITVDPKSIDQLVTKFKNEFNRDLFIIGNMTQKNKVNYQYKGQTLQRSFKGFDHFYL